MSNAFFITHPEVVIDPAMPVPEWPLSATGFARMAMALERPWMQGLRSVFCSGERKATDAAGIIADRVGLLPKILPNLGENDRSATGCLPRAEFELTADAFFAQPEESIRGWERAADARRRIVAAVDEVLTQAPPGDLAIVSHGGVGALLLGHLKGVPISRVEDQPGDGGGERLRL